MAMLPLSALIRRRRVQLGLTQHELAQRISLGVTAADVAAMEDDIEAHPRLDWVERIATALELPPEALLRDAGLTPLWPVSVEPVSVEPVSVEPVSKMTVSGAPSQHSAPKKDISPFERLNVALTASRETRARTAELRRQLDRFRGYEPGLRMAAIGAAHRDQRATSAPDVATTVARFNEVSDASP